MSSSTVWKFTLGPRQTLSSDAYVEMPGGAKILTCQMQGDTIVLYAKVDPDTPPEIRMFQVIGTGQEIPEELDHEYVGTVQYGPLVFHVFELLEIGAEK